MLKAPSKLLPSTGWWEEGSQCGWVNEFGSIHTAASRVTASMLSYLYKLGMRTPTPPTLQALNELCLNELCGADCKGHKCWHVYPSVAAHTSTTKSNVEMAWEHTAARLRGQEHQVKATVQGKLGGLTTLKWHTSRMEHFRNLLLSQNCILQGYKISKQCQRTL